MRRTYKIIYFFCLILTTLIAYFKYKINNVNYYDLFTLLGIVTSILTIIYSLKNNKKSISKKELILPISYIIYLILMCVFAYIYNINAIDNDIVYTYYYKFILIPYIGLNLYTVLLFKKEKEN